MTLPPRNPDSRYALEITSRRMPNQWTGVSHVKGPAVGISPCLYSHIAASTCLLDGAIYMRMMVTEMPLHFVRLLLMLRICVTAYLEKHRDQGSSIDCPILSISGSP